MTTHKNYAKWGPYRTQWFSMEAFMDAPALVDGVHSVPAGGTTLELLIKGNPFESSFSIIPVFFSGATTKREELAPPFFSGGGISTNLGLPSIAISDPLVDSNSGLNLGWYTGAYGGYFQRDLSLILKSLVDRFSKELLFTGGSGGGFASLYYAGRIGKGVGAFVWNAQTSVLNYWEPAVKNYLTHNQAPLEMVNSSQWKTKIREWRRGKLDVELIGSHHLLPTNRLIYLQNKSDWHKDNHLMPWLDTEKWKAEDKTSNLEVYRADANHSVVVGDFAKGHAPIPQLVSNLILSDIIKNNTDIDSIIFTLDKMSLL